MTKIFSRISRDLTWNVLRKILMAVLLVLFLFPIYMAVLTAFKTKPEIAGSVISLPHTLYLGNFAEGIKKSDFFRAICNTCAVTFPSVLLIVICSSMCGYTIARNGKRTLIIRSIDKLFLASLMIPFQIIMIPVYKIFKTLNLQNNLMGMVLMLTGTSIAYSSFLYVGFVKSIPLDIEEAAMIDGCDRYQTFFRITFPLLKPISATVAALHVMWLWNDFNIALILLQKDEVRTLTVKQFYFFGQYTADYGVAFAVTLLSMIPVVIFFLMMQKYIVNGIAAGAVKS